MQFREVQMQFTQQNSAFTYICFKYIQL